MALAIPATVIMLAMIGKWLFTPVKPIVKQPYTNFSGKGDAPNSKNIVTYNPHYTLSDKYFHVHA